MIAIMLTGRRQATMIAIVPAWSPKWSSRLRGGGDQLAGDSAPRHGTETRAVLWDRM